MPKGIYNRRKSRNRITQDVPKKRDFYELPGGALRTSKKPGYHMIPAQGIRRIAERFSFGADRYGEDQWLESVEDADNARAFSKEVFNHMAEHLFEMSNSLDPKTDHLGAIGWAMTVLAYVEDVHGCPWTEL